MPAAERRLAVLPTAEWGEQERAFLRGHLASADKYLSADPDGPAIPPILGLLARHPRLGGAWLSLSGVLLDDSSLAVRDRELLILRVGHRTDNRYLWSQHLAMGAEAGLGPDDLRALGAGPATDHWSERDLHLVDAVDELIDQQALSDETWRGLRAFFDEQQLLELLFLVGSYACLAMVLNSVGLEPQAQE
jgi:4-carboxymuconolactone decarboxylase